MTETSVCSSVVTNDGLEPERTSMRVELSHMSFEELQQLKEKIGSKLYKEMMFGQSGKRRRTPVTCNFKGTDPSRPKEMSAKRPAPEMRGTFSAGKPVKRDPRFDKKCGEFSDRIWRQSYGFVKDIRMKEKLQLKKELQEEQDPKRRKHITSLLRKMDDRERSELKKQEMEKKAAEEKKKNKELVKEGKRPYYMKQSTRRALDLVDKYESLKKSGGLEKYMKKRRKKNASKDGKALPYH